MGLNKNPEIVKETAVYLVLTAAAAAAGFFLQPVCGIPVLVLVYRHIYNKYKRK